MRLQRAPKLDRLPSQSTAAATRLEKNCKRAYVPIKVATDCIYKVSQRLLFSQMICRKHTEMMMFQEGRSHGSLSVAKTG